MKFHPRLVCFTVRCRPRVCLRPLFFFFLCSFWISDFFFLTEVPGASPDSVTRRRFLPPFLPPRLFWALNTARIPASLNFFLFLLTWPCGHRSSAFLLMSPDFIPDNKVGFLP